MGRGRPRTPPPPETRSLATHQGKAPEVQPPESRRGGTARAHRGPSDAIKPRSGRGTTFANAPRDYDGRVATKLRVDIGRDSPALPPVRIIKVTEPGISQGAGRDSSPPRDDGRRVIPPRRTVDPYRVTSTTVRTQGTLFGNLTPIPTDPTAPSALYRPQYFVIIAVG